MGPLLSLLVTEGEAIYREAGVAGKESGSTDIHVGQVMDWLERSTQYVSAQAPALLGQVLPCRPNDSFENIFAAVFRMLTLLKSLSPPAAQLGSTSATQVAPKLHGEPPEIVKGLMWIFRAETWRKHPVWASVTAVVLLALLVEIMPHLFQLSEQNRAPQAASAPHEREAEPRIPQPVSDRLAAWSANSPITVPPAALHCDCLDGDAIDPATGRWERMAHGGHAAQMGTKMRITNRCPSSVQMLAVRDTNPGAVQVPIVQATPGRTYAMENLNTDESVVFDPGGVGPASLIFIPMSCPPAFARPVPNLLPR